MCWNSGAYLGFWPDISCECSIFLFLFANRSFTYSVLHLVVFVFISGLDTPWRLDCTYSIVDYSVLHKYGDFLPVDGPVLLVFTRSPLAFALLFNLGSLLDIYLTCGRALMANATIMCFGRERAFANSFTIKL